MSPHSIAWSTGLTANGVDLTSEDLRFLLRVTQGLFDNLEVRGDDVIVPSLVGRIPFPRLADRRLIVAEGHVHGEGATEWDQRVDFLAIRHTIDDLMRGDQDPYELEVTLEDGSIATIQARPLRPEWGQDDSVPAKRRLALFWESIVPDWDFGGGGSGS